MSKHSKDQTFVISITSADKIPSLEVEQCWERIIQRMTEVTDDAFPVDVYTLTGAGQARSGEGHTEEELQFFREKVKVQAGVKSD